MKKRIISLLLAGAVLFTAVEAETLAAAPQGGSALEEVFEEETNLFAEEQTEEAQMQGEAAEKAEIFSEEQTEEEQMQDEAAEEAETFAEEQTEDAPLGGLQEPEIIRISDEAAESIGIAGEQTESAEDAGLRQYTGEYNSQRYDSAWDSYSSNYIYNRLSANERALWDGLDNICRNFLNNTANASAQFVSGEYYYILNGVEYLTLGLTQQKAKNVYNMFSYSNPQYYFLSGGFLYSGRAMFPIVYQEFFKGSVRKVETAKMKSQIDSMRSQVQQGSSDVEKAKIAHDLITRKVLYEPEYPRKFYTPFHQSAYSVFCDKYTVCAGYTKAFELLMNSVGIDAVGITSWNEASKEGHAWNAVCFNDSWYYVDCTWDDRDGKDGYEAVYTWFGLSETTLTGALDQQRAHRMESMFKGLVPKCTRDMGSTKDTVGTPFVPSETAQEPLISQQKTSEGIKVSLFSPTPGADIYYTINGDTPSSSYNRCFLYTEPFVVNTNLTVKGVTICNEKWDSTVAVSEVQGKMYTVKFDTKGGSKISSRKMWPQEMIKKPSDPKRKGYKFSGWYSNSGVTKKWNFNNKISKDTTLYAKWSKVKVSKPSIKKLKNVSRRKISISIGKVSGAKGYEIRYSLKSNMKSAKKKKLKSASKTLGGFKSGKTYYVQARAYKVDSAKKNVYGSWSKIKKVKITK